MIAASGAIKMHARNRIPVVKAVRPVRPPASTPDADSTKVVTVDVPVTKTSSSVLAFVKDPVKRLEETGCTCYCTNHCGN